MAAPAPQLTEEDLPQIIEIVCPQCRAHWANARVQFGRAISPDDFTAREDFAGRVTFQKNGLPLCPACQFEYTPWAIYAAIFAKMGRDRMEGKLWQGGERFNRAQDNVGFGPTSSEKDSSQG